jgi:hypothetical protein
MISKFFGLRRSVLGRDALSSRSQATMEAKGEKLTTGLGVLTRLFVPAFGLLLLLKDYK